MEAATLPSHNFEKKLFYIGALALIAGFGLTIISHLRLCSQECADVHFWRFFGLPFEAIGFVFFPLLFSAHLLSLTSSVARYLAGALLAGAIGAESYLILLQKFKIGHFCPVCLSIAATLSVAAITYIVEYFIQVKGMIEQGLKKEIMKKYWQGLSSFIIVFLGMMTAFVGVAKPDQLKAAEASIKEKIAFGNPLSPVDVFLFTDWMCPACRKLEPQIVRMSPEVMKKARLTFVDFAIHPETMNFTPYNLSFMVHNKDKYLQLRDALTEVSLTTKEPSDEQIEKAAESLGVRYKPLLYADVAVGVKYFKHLADQFNLDTTPTMIIVNSQAKKGKKLIGREINQVSVLEAIETLSK